MKTKLLATTTALALTFGSGAINAQTRTNDPTADRANTTQNNSDRTTPARDTDRMKRPQTSGQSQAPARSQAPTTGAGTDQKGAQQPSTATQGTSGQSGQPQATQNQNAPATRSNQANEPSATAPATGQNATTNQPSAQRDSSGGQTNQATSPSAAPNANQQATGAQSGSPQRLSASLQTEQKTQLNQAISKLDARPVTNVNFAVSVGTVVPTSVSLRPLPSAIVAVIPQYRGYDYFVVRDEVVIVEPRTHRIVDVIERRGPSQARTTTSSERRVKLSDKQRTYIRQHATTRRSTTTGSAPSSSTRIIVGEEVPDSVTIESFPEEVYREVPAVRSYRYIPSDRGLYLVEPGSRRVIEEID